MELNDWKEQVSTANSHSGYGFQMVPEEVGVKRGSNAAIRTFELIKHLHLFHQFCEIFPWVFAKDNGKE